MGYYTNYSLYIEDDNDESVIQEFRKEYEGAEHAID